MTASRPLRILVVEDHADTALVTSKLLSLAGHVVSHALTAKQARELAAQDRYDLLISDIGLPDESGLELMRSLKEMYGLTGIAVSGLGELNDEKAAEEAGFAARMVKPIIFDNLLRTIQEVSSTLMH
jgi:two-component system CheB/CheR fusion protein